MKSFLLLPLIVAFVGAAPAPKPNNFEADTLLDVGPPSISSYATKRGIFESDTSLEVGNEIESSYATKRDNFESDSLL
ncbi:hypothetical protein F4677DRAFT_412273 [Hypoxylon crocopeplum]|nr:hypothetical protein F4677DRAFT_412273 [Hypoxylon crocopeplum]